MNFFVTHFIDFRNGLTFVDKKIKISHNFDVFVYALCERVGCTKLFWCHEKTNPRCTRPATVANELSHILTTIMFHPKIKSVIKELIAACIL